MKTINQINGQLATNATIIFYFNTSNDRDNYRNRGFYFFPKEGRQHRRSITGNFLYGQAVTEFKRITSLPDNDYYNTYKTGYFDIGKFQFKVQAKIELYGTVITVETHFKPLGWEQGFKKWIVRSNKTWAEFNPVEYFKEKILPKYLYPENSLFGRLQLVYNIEKKDVSTHYKKLLKTIKQPFVVDTEKAWKQLFKKRFNILIQEYIPEIRLTHAIKTLCWEKKRRKAFNEPSPFELYDMCSSVADTDEGMEAEFWNIMNDYPKNSIML